MDNVIIKYSDWFDNDGGFEKIKSEFKSLGDDLIKEAKRIKDGVNIFDLSNADGIQQYEESAEKLTESFKEYAEAKKQITKIENDYVKQQKASIKATQLQSKNLAELEEKLGEYRLDLKKTTSEEKLGVKTVKESAESRADLKLKIKAVTKEIGLQQKEIIESNKLSKTEEKLLKANVVLQKDRAETLSEVRERLSALRLVASQVNITTQEGRDTVAEYNAEIDELTENLEQNSDKFVQSKINVGNYEESIVNSLNSTSLFSTQIGVLDNSLSALVGLLTLNKEQLEEMETALGKNGNAIQRFAISFGKLNKVLKASIIGAVVVAIAALGSVFGNTRSGAIKTEKALMTFQNSLVVFGNVAAEIFSSIGGYFSGLFDSFKKLSEISIKDIFTGKVTMNDIFGKDAEEETDNLFERIKKIAANGTKAIEVGFENIDRAFKLEDKVRRLSQELEVLNGQLSITESISADSTKSLLNQLNANKRALLLTDEIGKKRREIAKLQLEAINERVKQNIRLNSEELKNINISQKGESFAKATLRLAERRGSGLKISNELLEEQQAALIELQTAENDLQLTREENFGKRREIERDLFEQNLDLLIDLIDTEKNLTEQRVNDVTRVFKDRVVEFEKFVQKFKINAQKELNEFNKLAANSASIIEEELSSVKPKTDFDKERISRLRQQLLDLKNIDLQVEFDKDGNYEVFNNGVKLTLDDIVKLNKELQSLGLAEIPINRFREFNIETTNAVRDFKDINKQLKLAKINFDELTSNVVVDEDEIGKLSKLEEKIKGLSEIKPTSENQAKTILGQIKKLEEEKEKIIRDAENKRTKNRLDAINKELNQVDKANSVLLSKKGELTDGEIELEKQLSQRGQELRRERAGIQKTILENSIEETNKATKGGIDKQIEDWEKLEKKVTQIITQVFSKIVEVGDKEVDAQEEKIDTQDELVDEQRSRAEQGLSNTYAFELRERAKQEAELIKRQKRLDRLQKLQSYWNTFNANVSSLKEGEDSSRAITKTLRDIAIVESLTASISSFGEGGIVGVDGVRTNSNGITRGRSHNKNGGVLAYHEGGEGFLSRREIQNMGEGNFRAIKSIAGRGPLDTNFFSGQQQEFSSSMASVTLTDPRLVNEMRAVKEAIISKPGQSLNIPEVVDGVLRFTETITKNNSVKRNHYRIKRPKL